MGGNTRIIDYPGVHDPGAIVDMGAYERTIPVSISGTAGADQFYVRTSSDHSLLQVWAGDSPSGEVQNYGMLSIDSLTFNTGGGDTIYFDFSNGSVFNGSLRFADVMNNRLTVLSGDLWAVNAMVKSGYDGGKWDGAGIITTSYHSTPQFPGDKSPYTTLGVAQVGNDVVVSYTYAGDVDLNGIINAADFAKMKNGAINQVQIQQVRELAYGDGDIDFNGVINVADFALAKSVAISQGAPLAVTSGESSSVSLPSSVGETSGAIGVVVPKMAFCVQPVKEEGWLGVEERVL
jgi:hypothetical protein